ncbi:MAG: Holliday junction resolvase RuvX [Coriobacteriales bacterium]
MEPVTSHAARRVLALDIGERRIGVATSDASGKLAFPVCVLPAAEVTSGARSFRNVLADHEPELLVVGLPLTMAGEQGRQAERIRSVAAAIAEQTGLPVAFCDERLSSSEAKRILREQGVSEKEARGSIDKYAAALFLQAWLDAR